MGRGELPVTCVGLSHHTAPVDLLERLFVSVEAAPAMLQEIGRLSRHEHPEVVLLSTCNRSEIYAVGAGDRLVEHLSRRAGLTVEKLMAHLYVLEKAQAASHLLRVASGLESLVVGESQILGQVSDAYAMSQRHGFAGPVIAALFETAIRCGKRVRHETEIARSAASLSDTAVHLAERITGNLAGARVLVVGSGEMGRLALRSLHARGAGCIDIINRHFDRAALVARRFGAKAHFFHNLPCLLEYADVVVSSTSASEPIISVDMVRDAMRSREGRPLVLIDVALPRDIDPRVDAIPGVHRYDVDSLKGLEEGHPSIRELPRVERIIDEELAALGLKAEELRLRPVIADLWMRADEIRSEVLAYTRAKARESNGPTWEQVESLAQALVNKLLHTPATRLREAAGNGHAAEYAEALRHLFALSSKDGRRE